MMLRTTAALALTLLAACDASHRETPPTTTSSAPRESPAPAPPPAPVCQPGATTLCPVDEGSRDAAFDAYRSQLIEAVRSKDEAKLLPLVADDIRTSFGGGGGIAEFKKQWPASAADLEQILSLGGSFSGEGNDRMFWAPYVYSRWPENVDAFEYLAAVRAAVPLRKSASDAAPVVRTLDWSIVRVLEPARPDSGIAWRHVRVADGTDGWVSTKDVRSPIGYRAGFKQIDGQWKMTALVAGD